MKKQYLLKRYRSVKNSLKKRLIRSGYFTKPSFIIIGAQKAGTTALFSMLIQHPDIVPPRCKEVHFFDSDFMHYPDFHFYHRHFPVPWKLWGGKLTFEATPSYLYHSQCAERIYNYSADMKIVMVLRNPVDRAYSAWNMYSKFSQSKSDDERSLSENRTFEEVIMDELKIIENVSWNNDKRSYVKRGIYHEQIKRYLKYFNRESIHVIDYNELCYNHQNTMHVLCKFLNINANYIFELKKENVSMYSGEMDEKIRNLLKDFYYPHNCCLNELLGIKFDW